MAVFPLAHVRGPSLTARLFGLGSAFGKTLRDSRWTVIGLGLVLGLLTIATAFALGDQFNTVAARAAIAAQMEALPAMFRGLLGVPLRIDTLPGFLSWRAVGFMPVVLGMWSVAALSGTLAGEASRGSLELIVAAPVSRSSLALQKLAAHAVAMLVIVVLVTLMTMLGGVLFGSLPGDQVDPLAAFAEFAMVGIVALFAGSIAFGLAPLLGRTLGAGIGGVYLFASYVANGYAEFVPGFDVLRLGSAFYWTSHHRPLAGVYDWAGVAPAALLAVGFGLLGVAFFVRRDLASTVRLGTGLVGRLPTFVPARLSSGLATVGSWSLNGTGARSLAERLPSALGWGGLMGLYGFVIAVSADQFAQSLTAVPQMAAMVKQFYPNIDFTTAGGILQLAIFGFVALLVGVAASTLISGWASDEREGRLEVVLATPIRRLSWFLHSGGAVLLAVAVMSVIIGAATGLGAALSGDAGLPVFAGSLVIGAYAGALAGVGLAVSGLGWPQLAGPAVAVAALGFYLLDLIGGILRLSDDLLNLALVRHLGQPMVGTYDAPGLVACLVLAVGGLAVGAWAFARRDLR
ncbi:MAG: ABC transporter permease subunit [Candidatus Limnocylindrales bacterium]